MKNVFKPLHLIGLMGLLISSTQQEVMANQISYNAYVVAPETIKKITELNYPLMVIQPTTPAAPTTAASLLNSAANLALTASAPLFVAYALKKYLGYGDSQSNIKKDENTSEKENDFTWNDFGKLALWRALTTDLPLIILGSKMSPTYGLLATAYVGYRYFTTLMLPLLNSCLNDQSFTNPVSTNATLLEKLAAYKNICLKLFTERQEVPKKLQALEGKPLKTMFSADYSLNPFPPFPLKFQEKESNN